MISIRILKICDESICNPLQIIFWPCLENVVSVFKENNKQELKNYRHIFYCLFQAEFFIV